MAAAAAAASSNPLTVPQSSSPPPKILFAKPGLCRGLGGSGAPEDDSAAATFGSRLPSIASLNLLSDSWDFNSDRFLPIAYDAALKQLKHLKPMPQDLLESLDKELGFLGPEMTSSIATAIAQGNLDPCKMKALNHFPDPIDTITMKISRTCRVQKQDKPFLSSKVGCFSLVSSCKSRKEQNTVTEQKLMPSTVEKEYLNGALELEKLKILSKIEVQYDSRAIIQKEVPKHPDNNPFKKRKVEEIQLEQTESATEQVLVLTDSDTSEIMCLAPDSQQSVDPKPVKAAEGDRPAHKEKRMKRSNCHSTVQKSSILNFFSRV